jgi:hypothetical protein
VKVDSVYGLKIYREPKCVTLIHCSRSAIFYNVAQNDTLILEVKCTLLFISEHLNVKSFTVRTAKRQ